MNTLKTISIALLVSAGLASPSVDAQRSGQSMQIQYDIAVSSSYVQEKSDAAFDRALRKVEILCND